MQRKTQKMGQKSTFNNVYRITYLELSNSGIEYYEKFDSI